jgi:hypothetical protein
MLWGCVFNVLLHVCFPSQLMSGALHSQCFSSDVTVFNDANTTENNPDLGEYHACSADKGDADCPGPPGTYICRFGCVSVVCAGLRVCLCEGVCVGMRGYRCVGVCGGMHGAFCCRDSYCRL